MSRCTRRWCAAAAGALVAVTLGGCTAGTADPQPTLVTPSGSGPVTCQEHQTAPPGTDYAGGAEADTAKVFTLLKYWNANGDRPFCDGEPANDADRAWSDLVDRLLDDDPLPTTAPAPTTT